MYNLNWNRGRIKFKATLSIPKRIFGTIIGQLIELKVSCYQTDMFPRFTVTNKPIESCS